MHTLAQAACPLPQRLRAPTNSARRRQACNPASASKPPPPHPRRTPQQGAPQPSKGPSSPWPRRPPPRDPDPQPKKPAWRSMFSGMEVGVARAAMLGAVYWVVTDLAGAPPLVSSVPPDRVLPAALVAALAWGAFEAYQAAARRAAEDQEAGEEGSSGGGEQAQQGRRRSGGTSGGDADTKPPALGVWSSWVGGLAGFLSGGWWFEKREMSAKELRRMETAEVKHGRLAMLAVMGMLAAALVTGYGPVRNLLSHTADPFHTTVIQQLGSKKSDGL